MKLSFSSITGVTVKDLETLDSGIARVYENMHKKNKISLQTYRKENA